MNSAGQPTATASSFPACVPLLLAGVTQTDRPGAAGRADGVQPALCVRDNTGRRQLRGASPNPFHCDVGSDVGRVSGIRAHKTKKPMMATTANPRSAIALPKCDRGEPGSRAWCSIRSWWRQERAKTSVAKGGNPTNSLPTWHGSWPPQAFGLRARRAPGTPPPVDGNRPGGWSECPRTTRRRLSMHATMSGQPCRSIFMQDFFVRCLNRFQHSSHYAFRPRKKGIASWRFISRFAGPELFWLPEP